jgi:uncharacterized membrane protein
MNMSTSEKSGTGLPANVAGALSYLFGAVTGVLFYALETDKSVRFNALQSIFATVAMIVLWVVVTVVSAVLAFIPILGWIIGVLLWLVLSFGGLVLWLYLMWTAFQGKTWRLPYIADMVDKYAPAQ